MKKTTLLLFMLLLASTSFASTITSAQTGNWTVTTTWVGGVVPVAGDAVVITDGHVITATAAIANIASLDMQGSAKLIFNGTAPTCLPASATYTYGANATIEFQGAAQTIPAINYPNLIINASGTKTFTTGAASRTITGNLTVSSKTLSLGATTSSTLIVTGNAVISGTDGKILLTGGDLIINGNLTVSSTAASSPSLYFSSTVARVMGGTSQGTGTFTVQNGACVRCIYSSTTADATTQNPITKQFPYWQTIDLQQGSVWQNAIPAGANGIRYQDVQDSYNGNIVNYKTLVVSYLNGASTATMNTQINNPNISTELKLELAAGAASNPITFNTTFTNSSPLTIPKFTITQTGVASGTYVQNVTFGSNDINVTGDFSSQTTTSSVQTGTTVNILLGEGAVNVGGNMNLNTSSTTNNIATTSKLVINTGALSVAGNLTLGSTGTQTLQNIPYILFNNTNSSLTVNGIAKLQSLNSTDGNLKFTNNSNAVTFNGPVLTLTSNANVINNNSFTPAITYNNATVTDLTINNGSGFTLLSPTTVNGILTLTKGNLTTGNNTLIIGSAGSVTRTSGHIIGNLAKNIATGATSKTFEIGTSLGYSPIEVMFGNVTVSDNLTAKATEVTHPNAITAEKTLKRYWTLTPGGSLAFDNYSATLNYLTGDFNTGVIEATDELNLVVGQYITEWSFPSIGTRTVNLTADGGSIQITGLTGFSDFEICKDAGALPVELTTFTAHSGKLGIELAWKTATEVNNNRFDVERSVNSKSSAIGWEKIGEVSGNGNSNAAKSYSFTDKTAKSGKYSYRLKQIDNDGKFEYSQTVEINLGSPKNFEMSQNYPNPFNPSTVIRFDLPQSAKVKLTVYNTLGQAVSTLADEFMDAGSHDVSFNAGSLSSGIYFYRLQTEGYSKTMKMQLIK